MHDTHDTHPAIGRLALTVCVLAAMLMLAAGAAMAGSKPQFSDYPSLEGRFTGAAAKLDTSGPDWAARLTEEILAVNDAMAAGANFAGYFVMEEGAFRRLE